MVNKWGVLKFKLLCNSGNTSDILIQSLESRLDALLLRSGFARTIYQARQLVTHGHLKKSWHTSLIFAIFHASKK